MSLKFEFCELAGCYGMAWSSARLFRRFDHLVLVVVLRFLLFELFYFALVYFFLYLDLFGLFCFFLVCFGLFWFVLVCFGLLGGFLVWFT